MADNPVVRIEVSGKEATGKTTVLMLIQKMLDEHGFDCQIKSPMPDRSAKAVSDAAKALSEAGLTIELYEVHRGGKTDVM